MSEQPNVDTLSDRELRQALRALRVEVKSTYTTNDLKDLLRRYSAPQQRPGATPSIPTRARKTINGDTSVHGKYVNGKYVAPQSSTGFLGLTNTQAFLVAVLASGWFFMTQRNRSTGGDSEPDLDRLGLSGNEWAFSASDKVQHLNGHVIDVSRFEQFLGALAYHRDVTNLPVVLDVYSPSCGPCRQIAQPYAHLASAFRGKALFMKADSRQIEQISMMLNVRALPTIVFFYKGLKVHSFTGGDLTQLQQVTVQLIAAALEEGTFPDGHDVSTTALATYLRTHDTALVGDSNPTPIEEGSDDTETADDDDSVATPAPAQTSAEARAEELLAEYHGVPAKLNRKLRRKYGHSIEAARTGDSGVNVHKAGSADGSAENADSARDPAHPSNEQMVADLEHTAADAMLDTSATDDDGGADNAFWTDVMYGASGRATTPETIVIVGGGPAGLSAAIYAARAGLRPLVVAPEFGGQLLGKGVAVENFPGIFEGALTSGTRVVELMRRQALQYDSVFLGGIVESVNLSASPVTITINCDPAALDASAPGTQQTPAAAADPQPPITIRSRALIVAVGSNSKWLGVPGEESLKGHGVSSCATCDGYLFRDKHVMVVGGGDAAMEDALVLARTATSVVIVHRRTEFRASKILVDRVKQNKKIRIQWAREVQRFEGDPAGPGLTHVAVVDKRTQKVTSVKVDACFIAIGHAPNSHVFGDQLPLDNDGYVEVEPHSTRVKGVHGVFAAGDIADKVYRQAVTSAGTGAAAALDAERWLSETHA